MLELFLSLGALAVSSASCSWSGHDLAGFSGTCGASLSSDLFDFFGWRGDPAGALPRLDTGDIHGINLFKSSALAFHDEEVNQEHCDEIATCEDIAVQEVDVASDKWCEEGDEEVPEPIGRGRQSHAFGSVA